MTTVTFTRDPGALLLSAIDVEGERLNFNANNQATKDLQVGSDCDIHWRIVGGPGDTLVVTKTVNGADEEIVRSSIPDGTDRLSDFTTFTV